MRKSKVVKSCCSKRFEHVRVGSKWFEAIVNADNDATTGVFMDPP
jgi:hypothetical protein